MKSVRRNFLVLAIVVALAMVAMPTWADDDSALASAWEELIQWVVDLIEPGTASSPDPEAPEPDDEALAHVDPSG
ncbi:MAG: hypothetical protein AAGD06_17060 [Acidobacteriota bacterium]